VTVPWWAAVIAATSARPSPCPPVDRLASARLAVETVGRFALNSTLGLGGVIDVAKRCPFNLPWRPNGFSDTLGVYGVGNGPFIFVPLIGPTTVRDLAGGVVDRLASPFALGGPFRSRPYLIGTNVYRVLDRRAEQEDELARVKASEDPYAARRDLFFEKRRKRLERLKGRDAAAPTDVSWKCRRRRL
jgi:phospholipid-binding lipoprotein MlaA